VDLSKSILFKPGSFSLGGDERTGLHYEYLSENNFGYWIFNYLEP
jgi:hypothetical protein